MYASSIRLLRKVRREFPYDAILSTWAYPDGVVAARLAEEAGVPLITSVLGTDVNELPSIFGLGPQIRWGLQKAARVVAVSGPMGERVVELGIPRAKVVVQHNGVDGAEFVIRDQREARARLGLPEDRPMILYVGNVQPPKGVEVLVEAMPRVVQRRRDVTLRIVGSGADEAKLKARVRELGVEANVIFEGRKLHPDIPWWMAASDLFCLPSHMEGCPNVVLESLACGRPVVASRVGGVPELLDDRNGLMAPPNDPAALASALDAALARAWDPAALRATVKYLSWDAVAETYLALLREVLAERGLYGV
jgi:glycosyltransferase involved in cell wall biosynthesis